MRRRIDAELAELARRRARLEREAPHDPDLAVSLRPFAHEREGVVEQQAGVSVLEDCTGGKVSSAEAIQERR